MLPLTIPPAEFFDEDANEFRYSGEKHLVLEHSLLSISKWESKWKKPFLDRSVEKTPEEVIDYVRCMTVTQNVDPSVYEHLTSDNMKQINDYIADPMTATWFSDDKRQGPASRRKVTSELIYYWMISQNIPVEFEKWHLNRLLTLIRVFDSMSQEHKPMSARQLASRNASLNAARRKAHNSRG